MENFLIFDAIKNPHFLLIVISTSFIAKIYFLYVLIPKGLRSLTIEKAYIFLICTITGSMFGDIAWMIKMVHEIFFCYIFYPFGVGISYSSISIPFFLYSKSYQQRFQG